MGPTSSIIYEELDLESLLGRLAVWEAFYFVLSSQSLNLANAIASLLEMLFISLEVSWALNFVLHQQICT